MRHKPQLAWAVLANVAAFLAARLPRRLIVLKWPKLMTTLEWGPYVAMGLAVLLVWLHHTREAVWTAVPLACGLQGLLFWAVTDDAFELWSWLVHPLEFGEPPDDIRLWHTEFTKWRGDDWEIVKLWRYR